MPGLRKGLGWSGESRGKPRRQHMKGAPEEGKHRSTKDTKRWCKGVEGREHAWHWVEDRPHVVPQRDPSVVESRMECANCRKYRGPGYTLGRGCGKWNPPEWSSDARRMFEKTPVYRGRFQVWNPHKFYGPAF